MSYQAAKAVRWLGLGPAHEDFLRRHVIRHAEQSIAADHPLHQILIETYLRGLSHGLQAAEPVAHAPSYEGPVA